MCRLSLCTLACATLLSACSPLAMFSRNGGSCKERQPDCPFDVITSRPEREFQVVGVIDIEAFSVRNLPGDEAAFRKAVAKAVCKAGGDAVIPGVNGDKRYVLATVVKWVDEGRTTPICPKPPPDAGSKDAGKGDAGGSDAGRNPANETDAAVPAARPAMDAGTDASASFDLDETRSGRLPPRDATPTRSLRSILGGAPC